LLGIEFVRKSYTFAVSALPFFFLVVAIFGVRISKIRAFQYRSSVLWSIGWSTSLVCITKQKEPTLKFHAVTT
jgi:hypothetical protein